MSDIFVKLDAEYASDPKLLEAGPLAELLYVRSLCFCKRTMSDGVIRVTQLPVVALGIPSARKLADKLVEVNAWAEVHEPQKDGALRLVAWEIPAWLKRNKSAATIAKEREDRRAASVLANHTQHHVGKGKKPSSKCELCKAEATPDYMQ